MSNIVKELSEKGLAHPPKFLPDNVHYLTIMGSVAYGVSSDTSDMDVYGFCIPPKEIVFPHTAGAIWGFGAYKEGMPRSHFGVFQHVHGFELHADVVEDLDRDGGKAALRKSGAALHVQQHIVALHFFGDLGLHVAHVWELSADLGYDLSMGASGVKTARKAPILRWFR